MKYLPLIMPSSPADDDVCQGLKVKQTKKQTKQGKF